MTKKVITINISFWPTSLAIVCSIQKRQYYTNMLALKYYLIYDTYQDALHCLPILQIFCSFFKEKTIQIHTKKTTNLFQFQFFILHILFSSQLSCRALRMLIGVCLSVAQRSKNFPEILEIWKILRDFWDLKISKSCQILAEWSDLRLVISH